MKARALMAALVLCVILALSAHGACVAQMDITPPNTVEITTCPDLPQIAAGESFTITAGEMSLAVTAVRIKEDPTGILPPVIIAASIQPMPEPLAAIAAGKTATITVKDKSGTANVVSRINASNHLKYDWSIGPASSGDEDGDDESAATLAVEEPEEAGGNESNALRFRFDGDYARGGFFGYGKGRLLQTTATLNIDTTDQESADFVDNNRVALGVEATGLGFGRLWMHGTAGVEARVEKGFHHSTRNADFVAKVSGWVPVARSITLFPRNGVFIAAPLSFTASYGYRDKKVDNTNSGGRVFEASALYHLFVFDQYRIDLNARLTHNDVDELPVGTPKTQRMYKATVSYLANVEKGFEVLTSIENGSFGVMLKEVRQYFVGVAISKFNFSGSTP